MSAPQQPGPEGKTVILASRGSELALVAKRTYTLVPGGPCAVAQEQPPLVAGPVKEGALLVQDNELYPFKPAADLVIKAQAWAPEGRPVERLTAGVEAGGRAVRLEVFGDRRMEVRGGVIRFTPPEPFTSVALSYANAYGGVDQGSRPALDAELIDPIRPFLPPGDGPAPTWAAYKRNPAGKGFIVGLTDWTDGQLLPNLEDPADLLTPARLLCGDPMRWHRQPLPAGVDWFGYGWFPRVTHTGLFNCLDRADAPRPEDPPIREATLGWVAPDVFQRRPPREAASERFMCGASPALIFDHLAGDEELTLHNMDREHPRLTFALPADPPTITLRPLTEQAIQARPFLNTVVVDMEARQVSCVWSGRVRCELPHGDEQLSRVEHGVAWRLPPA